ncbi:hypothetical protein MKW98_005745 [Papaver atlanticum]|uniref:AMP-activated protein kinase glycogen-binding domain-containing protein n=1 Tax=Papaver atlanticum TaxID=357466 RepID=A0AAD4RZA3_9MAGN|nr:hypothetical protein MKW98_005745 [Papaver atlanticum]
MTSVSRWSTNVNGSWFSSHSKKLVSEDIHRFSFSVVVHTTRKGFQSLSILHDASMGKHPICHPSWRISAMTISLHDKLSSSPQEDESSISSDVSPLDSSKKMLSQNLASGKLISLVADSERSKILKKLSEANQHNRFLKRQLQIKEDALVEFKSDVAVMELEIQALVVLAEEIAKTGIPPGSRKINGKYIHSQLISRLEGVHRKLKAQLKDVEVVQSKEVHLHWNGMAETVQVMGSFDGWSRGESLSPEYTGSYTQFSATLMLRPGRYEVKFLVDGEWRLSAELPTTGEGMIENNLLIVE